jgi:putative DNA primase/helicase
VPRFSSYTEKSPSGTGLHVWLYATHDLGGKLGRVNREKGIEVYRGGRYFTLTGEPLTQFSANVEHRDA